MLEKIKLSLRLITEEFNTEIESLIAACKRDLNVGGVKNIDEEDPLILRAITLYCKGHFGYADIGEKYLQAYESLKNALYMEGLTKP